MGARMLKTKISSLRQLFWAILLLQTQCVTSFSPLASVFKKTARSIHQQQQQQQQQSSSNELSLHKTKFVSKSSSSSTSRQNKWGITSSSQLQLVASSIPMPPATVNYDSASPAADESSDSSSTDSDSPKVGVLLLNLGGPETGDDVEGFLYNLFADPDIIRLPGPLAPLQNLIALFISKRRAPKSRAAYESIGGGSPILKYSNAQATLLCEAIQEKYGLAVKAYIGMRYWKPFTEEALEQIRNDGIEALVIVPLYPQFSISTSGSSLRVLQEEFSAQAQLYQNMQHTVIPSWYDRPGYVNAMADLICAELEQFTPQQYEQAKRAAPDLEPLHVLFSAHGVPQSYIEAGDPYQQQIKECVAKISETVEEKWKAMQSAAGSAPVGVESHLSYQSRVGPIEWLRPYTDDVLPELGERGIKNLVVVPISFVSEHIETLEEIDIEYRELAEENGIENWRRCPALNTDTAFIEDMADMVVQALQEPAQTVTEACVANSVVGIGVELNSPEDTEGINSAGIQGVGAEGSIFRAAPQKLQQRRSEDKDAELKEKERLNARVAMVGVLITILVELSNGKSLMHMFGSS